MTPGVGGIKASDRTMACSKEFRYYCGFVKQGMDRAHCKIHEEILKEDIGSHGSGMLYVRVYRPLIRSDPTVRDIERDRIEAVERTIEFPGGRRDLSGEEKAEIRDHHRGVSPNGRYRSASDAYTGMMIWTVAGR